MNTLSAKCTAICVLFIASMLLGTAPILLLKYLKTKRKNYKYIEMLLCFGGGILLCTTLMHLLPEVEDNIEKLHFSNININYAELLMCIGFFLMYFIEEIVHLYVHYCQKQHQTRKSSLESGNTNDSDDYFKKINHLEVNIGNDLTLKLIRGMLIILSLSIHGLFEGLAVGLETVSRNVWYLFGAISAHKLIISFCVGAQLVSFNIKTTYIISYIFTFSIISPLGIAIGIFISENNSTEVTSAILQGLASGTLLYVVFFEILNSDKKSGILNFLSVLIGFLVMLGLILLE